MLRHIMRFFTYIYFFALRDDVNWIKKKIFKDEKTAG